MLAIQTGTLALDEHVFICCCCVDRCFRTLDILPEDARRSGVCRGNWARNGDPRAFGGKGVGGLNGIPMVKFHNDLPSADAGCATVSSFIGFQGEKEVRKEEDPPPPPPSAPSPVQLSAPTILKEGAAKRAQSFLNQYFNEADGALLKSDGVKQLEVTFVLLKHKPPLPESDLLYAAQ